MKNNFLKLVLSSFCIFSLVGCGNDGNSNAQSSDVCTTPYKVTYMLNDGTNDTYTTQTVNYGEKVKRPKNPTRAGYIFRGWYLDSECLVLFTTDITIKADTTLYALWLVDTDYDPNSSAPESSDTTTPESSDTTTPDSSDTVDPSIPDGDMITYSISKLVDWIPKDNAVIFAWVWSPKNTGSWVEVNLDASDKTNIKATFQVDSELTGMLLARCAEGTTTPDWNKKENGPGKVYNKTKNISVEAGVTAYEYSENWITL